MNQGKNVFIAGMPGVAYSWRGFQYHWPNKQWPRELAQDLENKLSEMSVDPPYKTFWYKAECTPGPVMITRGLGGVPGLVASKCAEEKYDFIKEMSSCANHKVAEILAKLSRIPFDVLSLDYVQDDVIGKMVELNHAQVGQAQRSRTLMTSDNMTSETINFEEAYSSSPAAVYEDNDIPIGTPKVHTVEVWESTM